MQLNAAISSSRSGDSGAVTGAVTGGNWVVMGLGGWSWSPAGIDVCRRQAGGECVMDLEGGCEYVFVGGAGCSRWGELKSKGPYEEEERIGRGRSCRSCRSWLRM